MIEGTSMHHIGAWRGQAAVSQWCAVITLGGADDRSYHGGSRITIEPHHG